MRSEFPAFAFACRVTEGGYDGCTPLTGDFRMLIGMSRWIPAVLLLPLAFSLSASGASGETDNVASAANQPAGLVLQIGEGERTARRPKAAGPAGLPDPFMLKVDTVDGGSKD